MVGAGRQCRQFCRLDVGIAAPLLDVSAGTFIKETGGVIPVSDYRQVQSAVYYSSVEMAYKYSLKVPVPSS